MKTFLRDRPAFSLVELSIVLVILGLLVGGILAGKSLIRAAELRSVSTEYQRYLTAANVFYDKYMGVPGDMSNATLIWGKDSAACNGHSGSAGSPGTCNGDGNGRLNPPTAPSATAEVYQFWKHLALAGLIEGTYTGVAGASSMDEFTLGTNAPRSRFPNSGWGNYYFGPMPGNTQMFTADYGNFFVFGATRPGDYPVNPILKAEEAWNIDSKIDDGKPALGRVIAYWWPTCTTATAFNDYGASYRLTGTNAPCSFYFPRIF